MRKNLTSVSMLVLVLSGIVSCQSSDDLSANKRKGTFSLNLQPEMEYISNAKKPVTKAVDFEEYNELDNYTVEIQRKGGASESFSYKDLKLNQEIDPGEYTLTVFKGEKFTPAKIDNMYVEGSTTFLVEEAENTGVNVVCRPANTKVKVDYDPEMDTYYTDYTISFKTQYTKAPFELLKGQKNEEVYLRSGADEKLTVLITLVNKKDGKTGYAEADYIIHPREFLTIHVKPVVDSGDLTISVTVDNTTIEIPVDIDIPSESLPEDVK